MALKESPLSKHMFITKCVVGMCGVGKFLKQWKEWTSAACPRCLEPIEDSLHVWK